MEKIIMILLLIAGFLGIATFGNNGNYSQTSTNSTRPMKMTMVSETSSGRTGLDHLHHHQSGHNEISEESRDAHLLHERFHDKAITDAEFASRIADLKTTVTDTSGRVFYVTDDGADPTGQSDSTDALQRTIERAFHVASNWSLLAGITDLGGIQVQLAGGSYIVSRPLSMPKLGGGNILIQGGTIRASASFPQDGYLIQLATSDNVANQSFRASTANRNHAVAYENIKLRDLMLDANYIAGGIIVADSLRTTIDSCYITHFRTEGILVLRGHETIVHNSFIGQHITQGGDPQERKFGGTGIYLMGNDNVITDVVIFSAAVGIAIKGQANILTGVHCYNKAAGFGGIGIHLQLPGNTQTRILGCYMDFTPIVMDDPSQVTVTNTFFLGDANVVLRATSAKHSIYGVVIADNMFSGSKKQVPIVQVDESAVRFTSVGEVAVERNSVSGMLLRSTKATSTVSAFASNWTLDFSSTLLFPPHSLSLTPDVRYSFHATNASTFPRHALHSVANNQVVIVSDITVNATVTAIVDQSRMFI